MQTKIINPGIHHETSYDIGGQEVTIGKIATDPQYLAMVREISIQIRDEIMQNVNEDRLTIEEKNIIIEGVRSMLDMDDPADVLTFEEIKRKIEQWH